MSYVRPQTEVFQDFNQAPAEVTAVLRAHISGPNAQLHRFDNAAERSLISLGAYDSEQNTTYDWPDKATGSLVDLDSARVFIENALLQYFEDTIGNASNGRGTVAPVAGHKNRVRSSTVSFKANGTGQPRSGLLLDRDAAVGDVVYIRGVVDSDGDCTERELWTTITGFAADAANATVFPATNDTNNQATTASATTIEQTAGATNCVLMTEDGTSDYDGLASGFVSEQYTVTVTRSSVAGCTAARLRVVSDSGTDNVAEVDPGDFDSPVAIGTRGLVVTFSVDTGGCVDDAEEQGVASDQLVVGQTWVIDVTQSFERVCVEAGETYTGPENDTYIVEVTKGGVWADAPEVTVTTTRGLDASGPTVVTGINTDIAVGSYGLTMQFKDCGNLPDSLSIAEHNESGMGNDALAGLRTGDKFYITVATGQNGPMRTLILRDDVPADLVDATDLDLRLFIAKTIEVSRSRISSPPLTNYTVQAATVTLKSGITAYDDTWTDNGREQPLTVYSGQPASTTNGDAYGTVYVEYREWLTDLTADVHFIDSVADLEQIPGQLDVRNPLKWGVFKALQNANGTRVAYTAVADPTSADSWQLVLDLLAGRDDVYNFVPLTRDTTVLGLFQAQVLAESSPEAGNWKGMVISPYASPTVMLVGKSAASAQLLRPTSTDGGVVLATLTDDPQVSGVSYTLLSVPANNSGFITYGVRAGDVVRFLFSIDAFSQPTYEEFVVDSVLSQNSLRLVSGHTSAITVAQKMEIWHTRTKGELVTEITNQAQAFANRRVVATWPDVVGTGGVAQEGYFLSAAVAGLASGVVPHQGLTNVQIAGFDDLSSRTTKLFTGAQLDQLAAGGVWIGTEDRDGTPHTRHALTTDTTDLNHREEMIRRNVDSISYVFLQRLRPFIGRANATPTMLTKLRHEVLKTIKYFKNNAFTELLGPQLIEGVIALDADNVEILRIHPLAADRVEVVLNLTVPAPLNNIQLHLVV